MRLFVRILLFCTLPFLALSALMGAGMLFRGAFIVPLTVENRTGRPLLITPVGTPHGQEHKAPLPTVVRPMLAIPSPQAGSYPLGPDESVTIHFDRDDITASELVLEDEQGRIRQRVINPEPNKGYRPLDERYVLEDFETLPEPSPPVLEASVAARDRKSVHTILYLVFLITPWLLAAWALRRLMAERKSAPPGSLPK
ncbi:hypothetical protein HPC49_00385 [Pyxidicoccus fallax]|uniref:Uncharacterized protein n=1 Tax=Pyxidicoccus fallax TaxID=394095 RepID=A0A848L3R7_9BACT|nr:hypothetical protein [Pyxidicoccus fallax]NMO13580.1 hypothetical protein [Pyxidicoccus fallax]NPC76712.1 hypothetical protein [Pyxidicoccus fallax]